MEQIDTVSKVVDEAYHENIMGQNENGTYLLKSTVSSYPTDGRSQTGTSNGSQELTLAVSEPSQETQSRETPTQEGVADNRFFLFDKEEEDANTGRNNSVTSLSHIRLKKAIYIDNPVFNNKDKKVGHGRLSFANVVTDVMQEPIKEDIHPFGRGSLYRFSLGGEQTQMQREEGTLCMWVLVTVMILGVAVGVIVMSQMYQAQHYHENTSNESSTDMNATEY